jgi:putative membrane protein
MALETLGLGLHASFRVVASVLLIIVGIMTPLQAWIGWMRSERALRLNTPLPPANLVLPSALP